MARREKGLAVVLVAYCIAGCATSTRTPVQGVRGSTAEMVSPTVHTQESPSPSTSSTHEEPAPSPAAPSESTPERLCQEMRAAYMNFRYEDAIRQARQVLHAPGASKQQRWTAYVFAGAAAYIESRPFQAQQYFQCAVVLYPRRSLDPDVFPEGMREFFHDVTKVTGE